MFQRPSFAAAWHRFLEVNVPVAQVGAKIGGKVGQNIAMPQNGFRNACPIRLSYVLNYTGVPVPAAGYHVVSGADHRWYMFRVDELIAFLERTFGVPDVSVTSPKPNDFAGKQGFLIVRGQGWSNATGHATIWNGAGCADSCHLAADPDNGSFTPQKGALWILR